MTKLGVPRLAACTAILLNACATDARDDVVSTDGIALAIERMALNNAPVGSQFSLTGFPDEQVVLVVCRALREDPRFGESVRRRAAFEALAIHKGARFADGYSLLMDGLNAQCTQDISARALGFAPAGKQAEVIRALHQLIQKRETDRAAVCNALWTLSGFQREAGIILPDALRLLLDASQQPPVRQNAAVAILRIDGPKLLLEVSKGLDEKGVLAIMGGLAVAAGKPEAPFFTTEAGREQARRLVQSALTSDVEEARLHAIDVMLHVWLHGTDKARTITALGDAEALLKDIAANDPAESVRERARKHCDTIPRIHERLKSNAQSP